MKDSYQMLANENFPKVSVGLPTYNRDFTLKQAIESVLNQSYSNIELVISDNASTDQTQAICEDFSRRDRRVKYIRQEHNRGPTENFKRVLDSSSGEFFMWLSDDDWVDSNYISECLRILLKEDDLSLAAGRTIYYYCDNSFYEGRKINHLQDSGLDRLLDYYFKLRDNNAFYGVMRKRELTNIVTINTMGHDIFVMATIAFLGKIRVLDYVSIHRRLGGTSESWGKTASTLSLPKFERWFPILTIAINAFNDISWRVPVFSRLGKVRRHIIASYVFFIIISMKSVPLLFVEFFKNILELCFGERRAKNIRSFLKKIRMGLS